MKSIKIIIAAVLVMAGMSVMGQTTDFFHDGTNLYYTGGGKVGIGTNTPSKSLTVSNAGAVNIMAYNTGGVGGATFSMKDDTGGSEWRFKSFNVGGLKGFKIRDQIGGNDVVTFEDGSLANSLVIKSSGLVGVGTDSPTSELTVNGDVECDSIVANGKITTKEVEVTLDGWSDYVFNDDYELMSLSLVEEFTKENKHLPGIPSEKEIIENGVELGEMNRLLMEKIEELTLYVIDLQKQIDSMDE